ncbi:MAG: fibronectin type III domain-containing protein, partial [bacterium]|nr:fibronectin type III domain-containing protein [bacterium]
SANNVWSTNIPAQCAGKCYPAPKTLPLTHESLQPKNIFDTSGKPKLPLNISWEENVEQELASSPCAVENYSYTIGPVTSTTQENQAVPGGNQCALTPNTSYEFSVKACANNTCGKASDKLSLTTSNALQLLSPYDPDWEEKEGGISPLPVTLQWCPHPEANSYHAQAYKVDPGSHERGEQVLSQGTSKNALKYSDSPERGGLGVFLAGDLLQPLSSLYEWEVFPCTGLNLQGCGLGSQAWRLLPGGEFEKPILQAPADNAVVNMQDSLSWNFVAFASRYVVRLSGDVSGNKDVFVPGTPRLLLGNIWSKLKFDSLYSWSVAACGGAPESKELTGCGSFSDEKRAFRTTGATPTGLSVSPLQNGRTAVPVTFDWDDKDGAASYKLQIGSEESFNVFTPKESRVLVGYPALAPNASQPNASFAWRVRTCADEFGTVCGEWASGSFVL